MGHTLDNGLSSGLILNCVVVPPPAPSVTSYIPSRALSGGHEIVAGDCSVLILPDLRSVFYTGSHYHVE